MGKWTTYLMNVYLGKLCVSSNLIQCKSAIHVIFLSFFETCARPPVTPDRAFNGYYEHTRELPSDDECGGYHEYTGVSIQN